MRRPKAIVCCQLHFGAGLAGEPDLIKNNQKQSGTKIHVKNIKPILSDSSDIFGDCK
jgi:hypothetical protein